MLEGRSLIKERQQFETVNSRRLANLKKHIQSGGKIKIELACGDGEFGCRVSRATQAWVLGIDQEPFPVVANSDWFDLSFYLTQPRFVYLQSRHEDLLAGWQENQWLAGTTDQTFLIMPYPHPGVDFSKYVGLWLRLAKADGELHVRSEERSVFARIEAQLPEVERLGFDPQFIQVPSLSSRLVVRRLEKEGESTELLHRGYKLI